MRDRKFFKTTNQNLLKIPSLQIELKSLAIDYERLVNARFSNKNESL